MSTTEETRDQSTDRPGIKRLLHAAQYGRKALTLSWNTSPKLTLLFAGLTLLGGLLPAAVTAIGRMIVDNVVRHSPSVWSWVGLECTAVIALAAVQRGITTTLSLLRVLMGHQVNVWILEKALELELHHFEDSTVHDKLMRAQREASMRPLSLLQRTFALLQHGISIVAFAGLLLGFSVWIPLLLFISALPGFLAEAKFSGESFRVYRWRSPERRQQLYLESVLSREDHAKEVKAFDLGQTLLGRYTSIFDRFYLEDKNLALRRGGWGFALGSISTLGLYAVYGWIITAVLKDQITLGQMTMYLVLFRQGQASVAASLEAIGGMYEDNLYLTNLYEFLAIPTSPKAGASASHGPVIDDGIRFENVSFYYPDATQPALKELSLHIRPGEKVALVGENGSGKTTLIKLLTKLYKPSSGRILFQGKDLTEWDARALRRHVAVIFQDFVKYQLLVGENIGVGDVNAFESEARWQKAATQSRADAVVDNLPQRYHTQLGRWFRSGVELSGGQWQKIALSRVFMKQEADVWILDEPTSAMDPQSEEDIFSELTTVSSEKTAILISHRFSTVRRASRIIVLDHGRIIEDGDHDSLLRLNGRYATLFRLQAKGYH